MPAITVVGSINRDIVAFVARHPKPGETVLGLRSALFPGGKGANQAVAAVRLRADPTHCVRLVGRVGADAFGQEMLRFLGDEGIDVAGVQTCDGVGTGLGLITVDAAGQNAITVIPGANHVWPQNLGPVSFAAGDIVIAQLEVPMAVSEAAFALAKAAGATTMLNPAPYQAIPDAVLAQTDILVLNEIEIAQMLGRSPLDSTTTWLIPGVRELLGRGPTAIIVTLGAAGALLVDHTGHAQHIQGLRAGLVVDTTGAGDCFVGALAAELLSCDGVLAAAQFANAAAAVSVTREGAAASIPRRAELAPMV
jgi:ribokinase